MHKDLDPRDEERLGLTVDRFTARDIEVSRIVNG